MTFPLITRAPPKTHLGIIGASGAGKSKLLALLLIAWIRSRLVGVTAIDPHGSFVGDVVEHCANPAGGLLERDLLHFNPTGDSTLGLNILEVHDGDVTDAAAAERGNALISVVEAQFDASPEQTPRLSRLLFVLAFAVALRRGTLLDVLRLTTLAGAPLRALVLAHTRNPIVRDELADLDALARTHPARFLELGESLHNRLVRWLADPRLARLLGQRRGFDPRTAMDRRQIVLFDLGGLDYQHAAFVGALLNVMYFSAAMRRLPNVSPPHVLAIDEAESIMTVATARISDITRKYGLFLCLSIQRWQQALRHPELADALLSNCGAWCAFRVPNPGHAAQFAQYFGLGPHLRFDEWIAGTERPVTTGVHKVLLANRARGLSRGESQSETLTESITEAVTRSHSVGHASTTSEAYGTSRSSGHSSGRSQATSSGRAAGESRGDAVGSTTSQTAGRSTMHVDSASTSLALSPPDLLMPSTITGQSTGTGSSTGTASLLATGFTQSHVASATSSLSTSTGVSDAISTSTSESSGESWTSGTAETTSEAWGVAESIATGTATSRGRTTSLAESSSEGEAESFVPLFAWLPSQVYGVTDQLARMQGALMSLQQREVIVRILGGPPLVLRTPELPPAFASDRYRRLMLPRFLARAAARNPWLVSAAEADAEIAAAQAANAPPPAPDLTRPEPLPTTIRRRPRRLRAVGDNQS